MENPKTPETLETRNPLNFTQLLAAMSQSNDGFPNSCKLVDVNCNDNAPVSIAAEGLAVGGENVEDMVVRGRTDHGFLVHNGFDMETGMQAGYVDTQPGGMPGSFLSNGRGESANQNVVSAPGSDGNSVQKVEVSGVNMSLYVDFTNVVNHGNLDEIKCSGLMMNNECQVSNGNGEKMESNNESHEFSVGDIVWAKTKNKTWWPGKVCDPSNVSGSAVKRVQKNSLLVGHFGNSIVMWCSPSNIKHFFENFEQMIGQNKGRMFLSAVEKAVDEFCNLMKAEMICSCVMKEGRQLTGLTEMTAPACKSEELGEFSVTHFEPVSFLTQLNSLALGALSPGMIQFAGMLSRLSAFFRFKGHNQLPMHLLSEKGNDEEGDGRSKTLSKDSNLKPEEEKKESLPLKVDGVSESCRSHLGTPEDESEGKTDGFELRERRRSKYLSYPYVTEGPNQQKAPSEGVCDGNGSGAGQVNDSHSAGKSSAKQSQKKWLKKFINFSANEQLRSASPAELLSKLHHAAVDYSNENKDSILIEWFFSRFRIYAYHDEAIDGTLCENLVGWTQRQENKDDKNACTDKSKTRKRKIKSTSKLSNGDPISSTGKPDAKLGEYQHEEKMTLPNVESGQKIPKKRKQTNSTPSKVKSLSGLSDVNKNNAASSNTQQTSAMMLDGKVITTPVALQAAQVTAIPDLNGNSVITSSGLADGPQLTGLSHLAFESSSEQRKRRGKVAALEPDVSADGSLSLDPQVTGSNTMNRISNQGSVQPNSYGNSAIPSIPPSVDGKSGKRKWKGKPKEAAGIPDLNGTVKPEPKRRRRRSNTSAAIGATLILTFAPGADLPAKEFLVTSFSSFGPLKESEVQLLANSNTAYVVFVSGVHAEVAFQSLQCNNPFGSSLVNYKLRYPEAPQPMGGFRVSKKPPVTSCGPMTQPSETQPPINFIKQNLEMMTSMLEKEGANLSPEMRTTLESEIKGLMQKVSSTPTSLT